jgi:predicted transposase YbfD/YdcC
MSLIDQLKTIADPRSNHGKRHPLWWILFVALLGSLCGYWGYRPLEAFAQTHHATLCELLELDPSTTQPPSYSTFRRTFQLVDAQHWVNGFNAWAILHPPASPGRLQSIDGKSIKCTSVGGNTSEQNFATLVSVYGQEVGVVRLELMYNAQASEIEVAKRLIHAVTSPSDLAQSWPLCLSLDALHAQTDTLALIASRQCHYLVGLKANQKKLYHQMQQLMQQDAPLSQATHTETLHGRQTQRTVEVFAAPTNLPQRWTKAGITHVVWVTRQGIRAGQPFQEQHCYLSNLDLDATGFLELVRRHWQIENGLHWVKDVTFQEDYPPRRGGFAPISWAVFHSFIITLARRLGYRTVPDCMRNLANQVHQVFRWLT